MTNLCNKILIFAVLVIMLFSVSGCSFSKDNNSNSSTTEVTVENITETEDNMDDIKFDIDNIDVAEGYYEITQTDIFLIENITAGMIQIFGLKIGDSSEDMIKIFGEPDILTGYDANTIFNCEYGKTIGLDETGIIIQIKDDAIKRITMLKLFNEYLVGDTRFETKTKYDTYRMFGKPDRQFEEPKTRVFFYDMTGIDILLLGKNVKGISIRDPDLPKESVGGLIL